MAQLTAVQKHKDLAAKTAQEKEPSTASCWAKQTAILMTYQLETLTASLTTFQLVT